MTPEEAIPVLVEMAELYERIAGRMGGSPGRLSDLYRRRNAALMWAVRELTGELAQPRTEPCR